MPDAWDSRIYLERAKAWRDKAASLPEDSPEREICRQIAMGYEDLACIIQQHPAQISSEPAKPEHESRVGAGC